MMPEEIVANARVPGAERVFVLGCFEQRVTVYAQQVRALNLVDALLSLDLVRSEGGAVAIIGGGVAGATAAVALAKAAPGLARLDLFERKQRVAHLQHNSRRFLHPHFYDWPAPGAGEPDAGLPIMNWHAGPAGEVAAQLRAEVDRVEMSSKLKVYTNAEVAELKPSDLGPVRVVVRNGDAANRIYETVILAVGFGTERFVGTQTESYWTPSVLAAQVLAQVQDPVFFISGNGDGGLVDFQMAAIDGHEHGDICELMLGWNLGSALPELNAIEEEAWAQEADVDLLAEYRRRVRPLVPPSVWAAVAERMRPDVRICLHTNQPRLLRRSTAMHNRVASFLLLETDSNPEIGRKAITVKVGVEFIGPPPETGDVTLAGETPFTPFKRYLRLGPDTEANLRPFERILADYRSSATTEALSARRPESPVLTSGAADRFHPFRAPCISAAQSTATSDAALPGSLRVYIQLAGVGRATWSGDITLDDCHSPWVSGSNCEIYCDLNAADSSRLLPAIARMCAHATNCTLFTQDTVGWRSAMERLWSAETHPGPNVVLGCSIADWREPPATPPEADSNIGDIADAIHNRLDAETLSALHQTLFSFLGPPAAVSGWSVEPVLRDHLWALWGSWRETLASDAGKRRRFLKLLASADDQSEVRDALLVRVGPRIVNPYLAKPTIFALTFAACSGRATAPAAQHPGNVAVGSLTGHTCGVEWMGGRTIRSTIVGRHPWTTNVVLLSQLKDAARLMEGDLRLDQLDSDRPTLGAPALSEQPIVIGADDDFLDALERGAAAVQGFFQVIFQRRAEAARQSLEEI